MPHLRRAWRRQADASRAARPGSGSQHRRRLLRARGVQVQPGHLGRPDDVQPRHRARLRARRALEGSPESARNAILYGIEPRKVALITPPDAKVKRAGDEGREVGFGGIARRIERYYRRYRQSGEANSRMEAWLDKVMVEHTCPDCQGARLPATRLLFQVDGRTIHEIGQLNFDELHAFLHKVKPEGPARTPDARCSRKSAAGSSCCSASGSIT